MVFSYSQLIFHGFKVAGDVLLRYPMNFSRLESSIYEDSIWKDRRVSRSRISLAMTLSSVLPSLVIHGTFSCRLFGFSTWNIGEPGCTVLRLYPSLRDLQFAGSNTCSTEIGITSLDVLYPEPTSSIQVKSLPVGLEDGFYRVERSTS